MSACAWCRWYILPCLACMKSRTAAARAAPLGPALWRAQPGSCRGPFGGCLRGRQHLHLHLHTLPCLHLHLPGTAHRPLHLHFFGRACLSPSRRDAPPSSASSARQARHVGFSPPPPPPSSMLDSMESLTALATSSLETSLFRPWPPRARRPSTPPPGQAAPARYRSMRPVTPNRRATASCVTSLGLCALLQLGLDREQPKAARRVPRLGGGHVDVGVLVREPIRASPRDAPPQDPLSIVVDPEVEPRNLFFRIGIVARLRETIAFAAPPWAGGGGRRRTHGAARIRRGLLGMRPPRRHHLFKDGAWAHGVGNGQSALDRPMLVNGVKILPPADVMDTLKAVNTKISSVMLDPWYNRGVGGGGSATTMTSG